MTTGPTRSNPPRLRPKEVCSQLGIQPYVLKFWENEFPQLGERVGAKRLYGNEELAILTEIQRLVDAERLNLAQAREALEDLFPERGEKRAGARSPRKKRGTDSSSRAENVLAEARKELKLFEERVERLTGELAVKSSEILRLRDRLEGVEAELRSTRQEHQALRKQMGADLSDALEAVRELTEAIDELDPEAASE